MPISVTGTRIFMLMLRDIEAQLTSLLKKLLQILPL